MLLSDIPVHREQKNEKCLLFDPHNPEELAELMVQTASLDFSESAEHGIMRMYEEAKEYAKALERVFL